MLKTASTWVPAIVAVAVVGTVALWKTRARDASIHREQPTGGPSQAISDTGTTSRTLDSERLNGTSTRQAPPKLLAAGEENVERKTLDEAVAASHTAAALLKLNSDEAAAFEKEVRAINTEMQQLRLRVQAGLIPKEEVGKTVVAAGESAKARLRQVLGQERAHVLDRLDEAAGADPRVGS